MNLPIYEQTRRTVPCSLLCDDAGTRTDESRPGTAHCGNAPIIAARPDEMRGVWFAVAAMVATIALILWLSAGGMA